MKVRKIKYVSGRIRWQLDLGLVIQPDGKRKRVQRYFVTQEEARGELAKAKKQTQLHGHSSLALSEDDRVRFCAARDQLAAAGETIEKAVELLLRQSKAMREPVVLSAPIDAASPGGLLERCLAAKRQMGLKERYLSQLKCSCLNFIRGRENRLAHTVTRDEVRKWVLGQKWKPKTQRVYLGDLRALFAWGVSQRMMAENPAAGDGPGRIELAQMEDGEIERLSVHDVKRMVRRAARRPHDGDEDFRPLLWYIVIGIYAGVRPEEMARIDRSAVSLEERHVIVGARYAKTRQRRVVDLSENCVAWLRTAASSQSTMAADNDKRGDAARFLGMSGKIAPKNFVRRWRRFRCALGLDGEAWPHDAMRHTFASMHYAHFQDEARLKAQMGHSADEDTLMRHYRGLATRREAAEFWRYAPSKRRR